jgi:hypothetical protein
MNKIKIFFLAVAMMAGFALTAQVSINTDGSSPDGSAMMDIKSTDKGMLIPRMDSAQRVVIELPAPGLLVYQTDQTEGFWYYDGAVWTVLAGGAKSWVGDGTNISNTNSGSVGIGTNSPASKLDVRGSGTNDGVVVSVGNSDGSHKLTFFGGRENDPNPYIFRKAGDPLRFATDENGWTEQLRIEGNGNVGIGTISTEESAKLEVNSTSGGFLPPRMTEMQRDDISLPATGLLIYQTDGTQGHYYYNGSAWVSLSGQSPDPSMPIPIAFQGDTLWVHPTDNAVSVDFATAVSTCNGLSAFSKDDWYTPSRIELDAIYKQSYLLTGLEQYNDWKYWSSTLSGTDDAFTQRMDYGGPDSDPKTVAVGHRVRCIRKN